MSVVLPAPFSPTSAWTLPLRTDMETARLATQSPYALQIPVQPSASLTSAPWAGGCGRR